MLLKHIDINDLNTNSDNAIPEEKFVNMFWYKYIRIQKSNNKI